MRRAEGNTHFIGPKVEEKKYGGNRWSSLSSVQVVFFFFFFFFVIFFTVPKPH